MCVCVCVCVCANIKIEKTKYSDDVFIHYISMLYVSVFC